jgi:hypothetical protein
MAFKRATFTLTTDANGIAEDDDRLHSRVGRPAFIDSVTFDSSLATRQATGLGIFELDVEGDDDAELERTQLFNASTPADGTFYPRLATVGADAAAQSGTGGGRIRIGTQQVRVRVLGGASGDVYTVTVEYETGGDIRF